MLCGVASDSLPTQASSRIQKSLCNRFVRLIGVYTLREDFTPSSESHVARVLRWQHASRLLGPTTRHDFPSRCRSLDCAARAEAQRPPRSSGTEAGAGSTQTRHGAASNFSGSWPALDFLSGPGGEVRPSRHYAKVGALCG